MDWSKGYSAEYYMSMVDPLTWRDTDRVEVIGGKVSIKAYGLRHSADLTLKKYTANNDQWIRLWLVAKQGQDVARCALFTGLASVPGRSINGSISEYPLACYSTLKPAEDVLLPRGYFAGQGFNGAETIKELLSVTPAPVVVDGVSPKLTQPIIAEQNENRLSMCEKILNSINWRMVLDGDGTIRIGPWDKTVRGTFGLGNDVIEPKVTIKSDWFSCPNVFRASSGDQTAIAVDDDPNSAMSTVNRGRQIWKEDSNVCLADGEGLQQYAKRRLMEEQSTVYSVKYNRRFDPSITVGDVVQFNYPAQNLVGAYAVSSQSIELGYGARVSEEVIR